MHSREQGFTLIEVMIVVVIIGILASVALPSYQRYVRKTICEDAKGTLVAAASALERFRAQHNSYRNKDKNEGALLAYKQSPATGTAEFKIQVGKLDGAACTGLVDDKVPGDGNSYCLTATPTGRLKDKNGALVLDSTGKRSGTGAFAKAWESCSGI